MFNNVNEVRKEVAACSLLKEEGEARFRQFAID